MNFALIALTTPLSRGLIELRQSLRRFDPDEVAAVSSVYRRIEEKTEGTLSSEVVVVVSLMTPKKLEALQSWVRDQEKASNARWIVLAYNHEVHLDPDGPVPHPELHLDPLILHCAAEIQGGFEHPVLGRSLQELVKSTQSSFGRAQFEFLSRGEALLAPWSEVP
jgi:7,8-dihydro-6-hydroxymethylpterin-pyrophosphokinase